MLYMSCQVVNDAHIAQSESRGQFVGIYQLMHIPCCIAYSWISCAKHSSPVWK